MTATKRSVTCECGSSYYEKTWDFLSEEEDAPTVWECTNCTAKTPRQVRRRKTNGRKALDARDTILSEWGPIDARLDALIEGGLPNGCLLVHCSTFNHHMDQLRDSRKISTWDLRFHERYAREDMAVAQRFCEEREGTA